MEWQPIETAPRDGTPILVFCTKCAGEISGVRESRFFDVTAGGPARADYPGDNWWDGEGDYYASWIWPTHWQALPPPPA